MSSTLDDKLYIYSDGACLTTTLAGLAFPAVNTSVSLLSLNVFVETNTVIKALLVSPDVRESLIHSFGCSTYHD